MAMTCRIFFGICLILATLSTSAVAEPVSKTSPQASGLSPKMVEAFQSLKADPPPKRLTNNKHYVISNEWYMDLWKEKIADLGGLFVGVGTDQIYMMAGWAKSDIIVALDFDQMVVNVHWVYWAFFKEAKTSEAFIDLWKDRKENRKQARRVLKKAYPDEKTWRRARKAYRYSHRLIHKRLRRMRDRHNRRKIATYLNDAASYDFIRGRVIANRVFAVRGNLLGRHAMRDLATKAKAFKVPVRIVYLSNTEQYFNYNRAFKDNLLAFDFDAKAVVLRTLPVKPVDYRYFIQSGTNLQAWLKSKRTRAVWRIIKKRRRIGRGKIGKRLYEITATPRR